MTKIRFEDLPSTNTPINAENLNKLNNVIVSSEEPTTGEEVWFEKGKNLFDKNNVVGGMLENDGTLISYDDYYVSDFIPIQPGQTYTLSRTGSTRNKFYKRDYTPYSNERDVDALNGNATFVVPENVYFIRITVDNVNWDINVVQLEKGNVATEYEPYTKKIHTKNDNGVYEEFYNEENREVYSTNEQRIGTWIDSKPLYRKTFKVNNATNGSVSVSNLNIDEIVSQKTLGTETAKKYGAVDGNFYYDGNYFVAMGYKDSIWYNSNCTFSKLYITIEYTKTTD